MGAEKTYVLMQISTTLAGVILYDEEIARRESMGEASELKRRLKYELQIDGTWGSTKYCEIWEEECAFGEGHYGIS